MGVTRCHHEIAGHLSAVIEDDTGHRASLQHQLAYLAPEYHPATCRDETGFNRVDQSPTAPNWATHSNQVACGVPGCGESGSRHLRWHTPHGRASRDCWHPEVPVVEVTLQNRASARLTPSEQTTGTASTKPSHGRHQSDRWLLANDVDEESRDRESVVEVSPITVHPVGMRARHRLEVAVNVVVEEPRAGVVVEGAHHGELRLDIRETVPVEFQLVDERESANHGVVAVTDIEASTQVFLG